MSLRNDYMIIQPSAIFESINGSDIDKNRENHKDKFNLRYIVSVHYQYQENSRFSLVVVTYVNLRKISKQRVILITTLIPF